MVKLLTIEFCGRKMIPVKGAFISGAGKIAGIFRDESDAMGPDPDRDVDSIVSWNSLSEEEQVIAIYNQAAISRDDECVDFELRKLHIDDQGYDDIGRYWGLPDNVWQLSGDFSETIFPEFDKFFRAQSVAHAIDYVGERYNVELDQLLVIVEEENDFTI